MLKITGKNISVIKANKEINIEKEIIRIVSRTRSIINQIKNTNYGDIIIFKESILIISK